MYLLDDKKFQTCQADGWADIDLTGPAGTAGTDLGIKTVWHCPGTDDLDPTANGTVEGDGADITLMTNGTVFMSCHDMWVFSTTVDTSAYQVILPTATNDLYECETSYTSIQFNMEATTAIWSGTIQGGTTESVDCTENTH